MDGLHGLGVVHRDLAARNVLVGVDLTVKVADYGLSREVTAEREYYRHRSDRPVPMRWMAPEVFRELKWTRASDVYSFGVLAYEVYSRGRLPFDQLSDEAVIQLLTGSSTPLVAALFGAAVSTMPAALFGVDVFGDSFFLPLLTGRARARQVVAG